MAFLENTAQVPAMFVRLTPALVQSLRFLAMRPDVVGELGGEGRGVEVLALVPAGRADSIVAVLALQIEWV